MFKQEVNLLEYYYLLAMDVERCWHEKQSLMDPSLSCQLPIFVQSAD